MNEPDYAAVNTIATVKAIRERNDKLQARNAKLVAACEAAFKLNEYIDRVYVLSLGDLKYLNRVSNELRAAITGNET